MSTLLNSHKPELLKLAARFWAACLAVLLAGCAGTKSAQQTSRAECRSTEENLGLFPATYEVLWQSTSPVGSHYACVVQRQEKQVVVVDGRASQEFEAISKDTPLFSPDGRHVAYTAKQGQDWFVYLDAKPGPPCSCIYAGTLRFSDDGNHLAYAAYKEGRCFAVLDGQKQRSWDYVGDVAVASSSKGLRFAYVAQSGQKYFAVVDGQPGPDHSLISPGSLTFSRNGEHVAYEACGENTYFVVLDGHPQREFEVPVQGLAFSPATHQLAYKGVIGDKWVVVVDGEVGPPNDGVVDGTMTFHKNGNVEYLVRRDTALYRVTQLPARKATR